MSALPPPKSLVCDVFKTGTVLEPAQLIVLSPNQEVVCLPTTGRRTVRMRRDFHFGEEDPIYFPQLFSMECGHLSVIPCPNADPSGPHAFAWYRPLVKDFEFFNASTSSIRGIGRFSQSVISRAMKLQESVMNKMSQILQGPSWEAELFEVDQSGLEEIKKDRHLESYSFGLQFVLARLRAAGEFERAAMTLALLQRIYLEMWARLEWLTRYKPKIENPYSTTPAGKPFNVVGACVGSMLTAQHLLHAGIPVWLARNLKEKESVKVERWLPIMMSVEVLTQRSGGLILALSDANPAYATLYEGYIDPSRPYTHYKSMAQYLANAIDQNAFMPSTNLHNFDFASSREPQAGPSRSHRMSLDPRRQPYPRKGSKEQSSAPRNKFVDFESVLLPKALKQWTNASRNAGEGYYVNDYKPAGYALPDPNIIAATTNQATRASFLAAYLKLREVLLYRLTSEKFEALSIAKWRSVLGIEVHGQNEAKPAFQRRKEVEIVLNKCLDEGNLKGTIDLLRLENVHMVWRGQNLQRIVEEPPTVVKEILWEMFEVNWRWELLSMDQCHYRGPSTPSERKAEVLGIIWHFRSELIPSDLSAGTAGFASTDLTQRRVALKGLYDVMAGWRTEVGSLPRTLAEVSFIKRLDINETSDLTQMEFEHMEFVLVHHYVSVFRATFGRAPQLPHRL